MLSHYQPSLKFEGKEKRKKINKISKNDFFLFKTFENPTSLTFLILKINKINLILFAFSTFCWFKQFQNFCSLQKREGETKWCLTKVSHGEFLPKDLKIGFDFIFPQRGLLFYFVLFPHQTSKFSPAWLGSTLHLKKVGLWRLSWWE